MRRAYREGGIKILYRLIRAFFIWLVPPFSPPHPPPIQLVIFLFFLFSLRKPGSSEKLLETLPPGELFCYEEVPNNDGWDSDSDEETEEEKEVKQVLEKASDHVLIGQITKVYIGSY